VSDVAIQLLRTPATSAVALLKALERVVGDHLTWEPESIWMELQHRGIDLPTECRAKILAGITLHLMPGFYWDAIVFEKTVVSLEGHPANADILEEPAPAWLAWAVTEARMITEPHEFQHEPRAYVGVVLARAGFALAPEQLAFAQKALDRERHDDDLRDLIAERWQRVDKSRLEMLSLQETREDVQIARLAAVELHVRERTAAAQRELRSLA
jgi:hypothetical protein